MPEDSRPAVILTGTIMTHMLADLDQLITEHELDPTQFTDEQWWARLRHAVDGTDYARPREDNTDGAG